MYPYIRIADYEYSSYNLCITVGVAVSLILFWQCEKGISKTDKDDFLSVFGILLVGGFFSAFLGNKLMHFTSWQGFFADFFKPTGLTFWCGAIGCLLLYLFLYFVGFRDSQKARRTLNAVTPYFVLGHMFGRLGCLLGGCCFGRPTGNSRGLHYPNGSAAYLLYGDETLYPVPMMEAIFLLLLFVILFFMKNKSRRFAIYLIAYSVGRFFLEFLRGDDRGNFLWKMSPAQAISIAMLAVGMLILRIGEAAREEQFIG